MREAGFFALLSWCALANTLALAACSHEREREPAPDASEDLDAEQPSDDADAALDDAGVDATVLDAAAGDAAGDATRAEGDGSADSASDAEAIAPCADLPAAGRCMDPRTVERCLGAAGAAQERVREACRTGSTCVQGADGARCELSGGCSLDEALCTDGRTLAKCTAGAASHTTCTSGCVASPLGSVCAPELSTRTLAGMVEYELRRPNAGLTDWSSELEHEPARGMLVLSYRGEVLLDAVVSSTSDPGAGSFSVRVAANPQAEDALVVVAAGGDARGGLLYALADPGFAPSNTLHAHTEPPPSPRVWSWRFSLAGGPPASPLRIREGDGGGAAYLFTAVRDVVREAQSFYAASAPQPVIAWWGMGTLWTCGACYNPSAVEAFGARFLHQLRFDGSSDQGQWSDAVTRHELGHYVMAAFGLWPRETSPRYFGDATNPGLAWMEGWATFFGASERNSSIYYDKQLGGFFWFDIDARHYAFDDLMWPRPSATDPAGLKQRIDENEVASMLWQSYRTLADRAPLLRALASPRMTTAPFERGYTRRIWTDPDHPESFTDTGVSIPHLADFLDALRCVEAISPAQLDAISEPAVHYPYPSASPLCR
jgi:hypothetical protein